ncbi:glycosyltransferase family 4 protein [Roseobacter sp.]|uniref:glycosyltransferase family 4 protein n=1 Tax=Roseobacter sp. TaxID=1907202 RepID=UPI00329797FC
MENGIVEQSLDPQQVLISDPETGPRKRLLFIVTVDWYFCSHRLALAKAARDEGYDVAVACRLTKHEDQIKAAGIRVIPLFWDRGGAGPVMQIRALIGLVQILRRERPDICHNVALKPVVFGSAAARIAGVPKIVNAVAGLGTSFIHAGWRAGLSRTVLRYAIRCVANTKNARFIFQNEDDLDSLAELDAVSRSRSVLIRGAGIDPKEFPALPPPTTMPVTFALVARMLKTKGIEDAVAASALLSERGVAHRLLLCGGSDPADRSSLSDEELAHINGTDAVQWLGPVTDVRNIWAQADVALQPSRGREGLPKSLLEAAACGRPMIATDVPGCREIARQDVTGFLVPERTPADLADAMERLILDRALRLRLGEGARSAVEREFSSERVHRDTLAVYRMA